MEEEDQGAPGPDEVWGRGSLRGIKEIRECHAQGLINEDEARARLKELGWDIPARKPKVLMPNPEDLKPTGGANG